MHPRFSSTNCLVSQLPSSRIPHRSPSVCTATYSSGHDILPIRRPLYQCNIPMQLHRYREAYEAQRISESRMQALVNSVQFRAHPLGHAACGRHVHAYEHNSYTGQHRPGTRGAPKETSGEYMKRRPGAARKPWRRGALSGRNIRENVRGKRDEGNRS